MHEIVKNALDEVNNIRKILGMEAIDDLPKGVRNDGCNCPVAKAIGLHISSSVIFCDEETSKLLRKKYEIKRAFSLNIKIPDSIKFFIEAFDNKRFPDYIDVTADSKFQVKLEATDKEIEKLLDTLPTFEPNKPFNFT